MIAAALDEFVQAGALTAEDEDTVAGEIKLVVVGFATFVEANDPEVLLFELFESADEIDDACDAEMFRGSGTGLYGDGAQRRGTALGKNDAIDTGAIGDAKKSTQILRVFDAIEGEDEAWLAGLLCMEEIFDREELGGTDHGDHALMGGCACELCQLLAWFLPDANVRFAAGFDETFETGIVTLTGDQHVVKAAATGFEGLLDRVDAVENLHLLSVEGFGAVVRLQWA